jgi:transforming growth factor-beta-induced protein
MEIMKPLFRSLACLLSVTALVTGQVSAADKKEKDIVDTAVGAGSFKTLATALGAAGLVETLKGDGPFTVLAPTDAAFAKLPAGTVEELLKPENKEKLQAVLKFHVIPGQVGLSDALKASNAKTVLGEPVTIGFSDGKVRINGASLETADVKASNGVIHVIDSVLLPPTPKNDIASIAKRAGNFNTLLAAVDAAGLDDILKGSTPVTVFAPTDAAFKALPQGTVESLLKPENRCKLQNILSLHVVKGKVSAGDALNAGSAKAVSSGLLKFGIANGIFQVNGATIVKTDIKCDNGVIHVIDAVLLPAGKNTENNGCAPKGNTAISAAKKIESAIEMGVPVFNHGSHGKCAEIYMTCAQSLANDCGIDCSTRQMISQIVTKAGEVKCDTARAWMLREGLDKAYQTVSR